ncbi:hypothetical protein CANARDRAFT_29789 [[Candida] arabinofermentans NRRL YB-2248]|uniref:NAD-dependent epimerase/dehydratase domain-containing protein n=1 Tax=[Candida] arabinofermentans NRRL YB-2248 TaxID=983967 RepID=A0A1E4SVP3_9ASCO|nr:hypothetical protein CANARDRAFT_29789 [[Candida] arabinofermentans NRRL YB-2248]
MLAHFKRPLNAQRIPSLTRSLYRFPLDSDINITKRGETKIISGSGGRSSRTGYTATVFGGTGFLGKMLVAKLAKHGTITICPYRNETSMRQLKVNGDLGVVNFIEFDVRNLQSIEDSLCKSDIVFNLIGSQSNTKNFTMADSNIEATRRIAKLAKEFNVPRFIQVSSYNANPDSPSIFYATKGIAEQVVREIIPDSTIVRPGPMYGRNSFFMNELLPLRVFGGNVLFKKQVYPTHAIQVAQALEKIGYDDSTAGKTYELNGTEKYSKNELREMIKYITHVGMTGYFEAAVGWYLPATPLMIKSWCYLNGLLNPDMDSLNSDSFTRAQLDQILDPNALGYSDLGMKPDELADWLYTYVRPRIIASSQIKNRTVYDRDEVEKLRDYVNTPKDSFDLLSMKG